MPRTKKGTPPSYRKHSKGQAVVTVRRVDGRRHDILLGPHNSPASYEEYSRVLAVLKAHGGRYPIEDGAPPSAGLSVNEVALAFWKHAEGRYGPESKELRQYRYSLRPLRELYGTQPAERFSPKCLRAVRQHMIALGWCRNVVNRRVSRIRAVFSWAVAEELAPASLAHGLREVKGLRPGESGVRESEPVGPAFGEDVVKAIPFCSAPVAAMLELQWLTGMRSGEVRVMRSMDLERFEEGHWNYSPGSDAGPQGRHKNAWRGQERVVPLGPRCIEILTPWINQDDPGTYLFQPKAATAARNAYRREKGKRTKTDLQLARLRKRKPKRAPGSCYTETSYPRAVARACRKAGVSFHPYMLRHGRKMEIEREDGSEAARCVLGQKSINSTAHYGKIDTARAAKVMRRIG